MPSQGKYQGDLDDAKASSDQHECSTHGGDMPPLSKNPLEISSGQSRDEAEVSHSERPADATASTDNLEWRGQVLNQCPTEGNKEASSMPSPQPVIDAFSKLQMGADSFRVHRQVTYPRCYCALLSEECKHMSTLESITGDHKGEPHTAAESAFCLARAFGNVQSHCAAGRSQKFETTDCAGASTLTSGPLPPGEDPPRSSEQNARAETAQEPGACEGQQTGTDQLVLIPFEPIRPPYISESVAKAYIGKRRKRNRLSSCSSASSATSHHSELTISSWEGEELEEEDNLGNPLLGQRMRGTFAALPPEIEHVLPFYILGAVFCIYLDALESLYQHSFVILFVSLCCILFRL